MISRVPCIYSIITACNPWYVTNDVASCSKNNLGQLSLNIYHALNDCKRLNEPIQNFEAV